jgi:hypothetical protein
MAAYLRATRRADVADAADALRSSYLAADAGATYDRVIELDLATLEPQISTFPCPPHHDATPIQTDRQAPRDAAGLGSRGWAAWADGPFSPDLAHPLSQFAATVHAQRWPGTWKVGSCHAGVRTDELTHGRWWRWCADGADRELHQQQLRGHEQGRRGGAAGGCGGPHLANAAAGDPGVRADPRHH